MNWQIKANDIAAITGVTPLEVRKLHSDGYYIPDHNPERGSRIYKPTEAAAIIMLLDLCKAGFTKSAASEVIETNSHMIERGEGRVRCTVGTFIKLTISTARVMERIEKHMEKQSNGDRQLRIEHHGDLRIDGASQEC